MTRIRATCPDCGNVEFGIADIVVVGTVVGVSRTYRFACPCCDRPVHRSAERDIIELLLSVGVPVEPAPRPPLERLDPAALRLPPLSQADVDAFTKMLGTRDWFAELDSGASER